MSDIHGLLLTVRRYKFVDENTGKEVQGAKLVLGSPADPTDDTVGMAVSDLSFPYDDYPKLSGAAASLIGKPVIVSTVLRPQGKKFVPVPCGLKGA